ncbi:MAG: hypothetical protein JSS07_10335 [Proteobacteria bacterium]|nr:hypothetical protein [Pseudomonadota bacterium]
MAKSWRKALLCVPLLFMSSAYADWQGNWLFGVSGIYTDRRGEVDIGTLYNGAFPLFPLKTESGKRYSDIGAGYGLLAGYQITCQGWIWGIEASVDWLDISSKRAFVYPDLLPFEITLIEWHAQSEYKSEVPLVALSGRMAYKMAPYFISYLRLGVEGDDESLDVIISPGTGSMQSTVLHASRWIWHYILGVGFEVPLGCSPITLRAEYNFHSRAEPLFAHGRIHEGVINPFVDQILPVFDAEMSTITNSGKVSFVWNFS